MSGVKISSSGGVEKLPPTAPNLAFSSEENLQILPHQSRVCTLHGLHGGTHYIEVFTSKKGLIEVTISKSNTGNAAQIAIPHYLNYVPAYTIQGLVFTNPEAYTWPDNGQDIQVFDGNKSPEFFISAMIDNKYLYLMVYNETNPNRDAVFKAKYVFFDRRIR